MAQRGEASQSEESTGGWQARTVAGLPGEWSDVVSGFGKTYTWAITEKLVTR